MAPIIDPLILGAAQTHCSLWIDRAVGGFLLPIAAVSLLLATPASAHWYLDVSAGGGRADQSWHGASDHPSYGAMHGDTEFESLHVWRCSIERGFSLTSGFDVGLEAAWAQRGAVTDLAVELERSYLEGSLPIRQSWRLGRVVLLGFSIAPRVSRFLDEGEPFSYEFAPAGWILGLDPELRIGYSAAFACTRYQWDLSPSYRVKKSRMNDRVGYFALGIRVR